MKDLCVQIWWLSC